MANGLFDTVEMDAIYNVHALFLTTNRVLPERYSCFVSELNPFLKQCAKYVLCSQIKCEEKLVIIFFH